MLSLKNQIFELGDLALLRTTIDEYPQCRSWPCRLKVVLFRCVRENAWDKNAESVEANCDSFKCYATQLVRYYSDIFLISSRSTTTGSLT